MLTIQDDYTTVKIRRSTLKRLNSIAKQEKRSATQQLDVIITTFEHWRCTSISALPHPPDAEIVPVINIVPVSNLTPPPEA